MNPYLIAGAAGAALLYLERDKVEMLFGHTSSNPNSAPAHEGSDFFNDFFDGGGQPATANGQNTAGGWADAVSSFFKLGGTVLNVGQQNHWWGSSSGAGADGSSGGLDPISALGVGDRDSDGLDPTSALGVGDRDSDTFDTQWEDPFARDQSDSVSYSL